MGKLQNGLTFLIAGCLGCSIGAYIVRDYLQPRFDRTSQLLETEKGKSDTSDRLFRDAQNTIVDLRTVVSTLQDSKSDLKKKVTDLSSQYEKEKTAYHKTTSNVLKLLSEKRNAEKELLKVRRVIKDGGDFAEFGLKFAEITFVGMTRYTRNLDLSKNILASLNTEKMDYTNQQGFVIPTSFRQGQSLGNGLFLGNNQLFLTCSHVTKSGFGTIQTKNKYWFQYGDLARSKGLDLALLHVTRSSVMDPRPFKKLWSDFCKAENVKNVRLSQRVRDITASYLIPDQKLYEGSIKQGKGKPFKG